MIKIFKKKPGKSEKLLLSTREILAMHGIIDKKTQDECAQVFFKSNVEVMKAIANKKQLDVVLDREIARMRESLVAAGSVDKDTQDDLILKFYYLLMETAGVK
jgi:hypothetical protein